MTALASASKTSVTVNLREDSITAARVGSATFVTFRRLKSNRIEAKGARFQHCWDLRESSEAFGEGVRLDR